MIPAPSAIVSSIPRKPRIHDEGRSATLGDLLYADPNRARVAEEDWVALVHAISRGEQVALRALFDRSHRVVFTLVMKIVRNQATAEELTLDVFHDVWQRAARYDPDGGPVLGWILNQARSRAIDRLRFEQRKKRVAVDTGDAAPAVAETSAVLQAHDQSRVLQQALGLLTPPEREAIEATYFGELTCAEASVRLNEPLGTLKTRIRSGLQKLRQALAQRSDVL
jgi:RNA polymerase sigma-70 factor (ECF subfamily)